MPATPLVGTSQTGYDLKQRPEIQSRVNQFRDEAWRDFDPAAAVQRLMIEMDEAEYSHDRIRAAELGLKGAGHRAGSEDGPRQQLHVYADVTLEELRRWEKLIEDGEGDPTPSEKNGARERRSDR
jgi:hypothetical protein